MAESELDDFLKGGTPTPEAASAPEPTPPVESTPKPEPEAKAPDTDPDDADPPEPREGEPLIPRRAYEDERRKRQDWKVEATKAQTERDELRRQLDEAKRAQQQPQHAPPPLQPIDPAQDPQGFVERVQGVMLNERLNTSELLLRKELGAEKVDAIIADFKVAAQADPSLFQKLYANPDPYGWAAKQVETLRLQRDIGDDPNAYKARLRAEWEAERGAAPAAIPVSPAAGMQPSLASVRSVAARGAPAFTGAPSLDDILRRK